MSQCAGSGGSPRSETDDDVGLACVPSTNTSRCTTPGPPILDFTPPHTAAYPKGKGGLPYDPSRYQASPDATRWDVFSTVSYCRKARCFTLHSLTGLLVQAEESCRKLINGGCHLWLEQRVVIRTI